jgi:aerotolerance regulator-like protein
VSLDWINPAALAGLAVVAGPVLVHLLRRQRAPRVTFPTIQFLVSTRAAATRFRRPSDLLLLCLRVAIVAAAAIAAAQPVLVTGWRRAAWEQRVSRALVVDDSESLAAAGSRVRDAVAAERQAATDVSEIRATNLGDGLKQAVALLGGGDAGRSEIVVISDFQLGSLTAVDVNAVPAQIGLRFVVVNATHTAGAFPGLRILQADRNLPIAQEITLDGPRTRVTMLQAPTLAREVTILSPPERHDAVASLRRIVAAAGAPALPGDRGLTLIFAGSPVPEVGPLTSGWMIGALLSTSADEHLRAIASASRGATAPGLPSPWIPVARDAAGHAVVSVAAMEQQLVAFVSAAPTDLVAAAALQSLLSAVAPQPSWPEREVERISASQLASWTRDAKPSAGGWRPRPPGDARWFWTIALVLLMIEGIVRRSRVDVPEEQAHAA